MRRAEMARRRKNLSEKRNEEEKVIVQTQLLLLIHLFFSNPLPRIFLPSIRSLLSPFPLTLDQPKSASPFQILSF